MFAGKFCISGQSSLGDNQFYNWEHSGTSLGKMEGLQVKKYVRYYNC